MTRGGHGRSPPAGPPAAPRAVLQARPQALPEASGIGDSGFDASAFDHALRPAHASRWRGWRLRALIAATLLIGLVIAGALRLLITTPVIDATWTSGPDGLLLLRSSTDLTLGSPGRTLLGVSSAVHDAVAVDAGALLRTAHREIDGTRRQQWLAQQEALAQRLATGAVRLHFADGGVIETGTVARGLPRIGWLFWPTAALAALLALSGCTVALLRPQLPNLLYAVMAFAQAGVLLLVCSEFVVGLGMRAGMPLLDLNLRMALDVITATAGLSAFAFYPVRTPVADTLVSGSCAAALGWAIAVYGGHVRHAWGWTQLLLIGNAVGATMIMGWWQHHMPSPATAVLRRFAALTTGLLVLVTVTAALTHQASAALANVGHLAVLSLHLFFVTTLVLIPLLSRPRRLLREFAVLTGVVTVSSSIALLAAVAFSLESVETAVLAVGLGLLAYVVARHWLLLRMVGARSLSAERIFELVYRVAREVHERPERAQQSLSELMRELFEPREFLVLRRSIPIARVVASGAALYVPLPAGLLPAPEQAAGPMLAVLRHAGYGQRLFTADDAQLAERVLDHVRRAVAYDRAVEHGRTQERQRIAQDLHDDIGARLLTLMYKAGDRDIEEYLRHTLQDLKTLTRGLAAADQRFSHAGAEWKADIAHRAAAAGVTLDWQLQADADPVLGVAQWQAVTRILRELVSNVFAHAHAAQLSVQLRLAERRLTLTVSDDGRGADPQGWAHGLGLGGVRKRVRSLGGTVHWRCRADGPGVVCEVTLPAFG